MASIGAVGGSFLTTANRQKYAATTYFESINTKYSALRMKAAEFKSADQFYRLTTKTNVLLSEEILAEAGSDEAVAAQFEKRLKEIPGVAKALQERFDADSSRELTSFGFTVDKRGVIHCRGTLRKKDTGEDERFDVKLGTLKEKTITLLFRFEREFDVQNYRLNALA